MYAFAAQVDLQLAQLVAGTVLPLLTGVVTKRLAGGHVKAVVLLALSAAAGFVEQLIAAGGVFTLQTFIGSFVVTFVLSVAAHFGLYKPTGVSDAVARKAAPRIGVGRERPRVTRAPA